MAITNKAILRQILKKEKIMRFPSKPQRMTRWLTVNMENIEYNYPELYQRLNSLSPSRKAQLLKEFDHFQRRPITDPTAVLRYLGISENNFLRRVSEIKRDGQDSGTLSGYSEKDTDDLSRGEALLGFFLEKRLGELKSKPVSSRSASARRQRINLDRREILLAAIKRERAMQKSPQEIAGMLAGKHLGKTRKSSTLNRPLARERMTGRLINLGLAEAEFLEKVQELGLKCKDHSSTAAEIIKKYQLNPGEAQWLGHTARRISIRIKTISKLKREYFSKFLNASKVPRRKLFAKLTGITKRLPPKGIINVRFTPFNINFILEKPSFARLFGSKFRGIASIGRGAYRNFVTAQIAARQTKDMRPEERLLAAIHGGLSNREKAVLLHEKTHAIFDFLGSPTEERKLNELIANMAQISFLEKRLSADEVYETSYSTIDNIVLARLKKQVTQLRKYGEGDAEKAEKIREQLTQAEKELTEAERTLKEKKYQIYLALQHYSFFQLFSILRRVPYARIASVLETLNARAKGF